MKIKVDYTHPYLCAQLYNPIQQSNTRLDLEKAKTHRKVNDSLTKSFAQHLEDAKSKS